MPIRKLGQNVKNIGSGVRDNSFRFPRGNSIDANGISSFDYLLVGPGSGYNCTGPYLESTCGGSAAGGGGAGGIRIGTSNVITDIWPAANFCPKPDGTYTACIPIHASTGFCTMGNAGCYEVGRAQDNAPGGECFWRTSGTRLGVITGNWRGSGSGSSASCSPWTSPTYCAEFSEGPIPGQGCTGGGGTRGAGGAGGGFTSNGQPGWSGGSGGSGLNSSISGSPYVYSCGGPFNGFSSTTSYGYGASGQGTSLGSGRYGGKGIGFLRYPGSTAKASVLARNCLEADTDCTCSARFSGGTYCSGGFVIHCWEHSCSFSSDNFQRGAGYLVINNIRFVI